MLWFDMIVYGFSIISVFIAIYIGATAFKFYSNN